MDFKKADSREAYFVLDAIANFNNYLAELVTGLANAQTDSNSFVDNWVKQFSYTSGVPASTSLILEILNEISAGLLILLSLASVAVPGLGEVAIAGATITAGATKAIGAGAGAAKAIGAGAGAAGGVESGIFSAVANALPTAE